MPLRALLYRRPSEPPAISIAFEREIYLVRVRRHRQARRYTLRIHSVTREVVLTMPPRGSLKQAHEFAQKHGGWIAARLGRLPEPAPFAHGAVMPLRGVDHRIVHRRGQRGTVWIEAGEAGERLLCVAGEDAACRAPGLRFSQARGQARSRSRQPPRGRRARRHDQARVDPRPVEPLGLVLDHRRAVLFVAADPRAALRARLSRGARGRASRRDESLARGSGAWSSASARTSRAPRPGSTPTAPTCTATACRAIDSHAVRRWRGAGSCCSHPSMLRPGTFALTVSAGGVERDRAAHHRHVSAVAAGHRAAARRLDRAGAAHHLRPIWSASPSGRSSTARCPTGTAASRCCWARWRSIARRASLARCRPRSRC